jgi:ribosomal protein L11 methyltransferase
LKQRVAVPCGLPFRVDIPDPPPGAIDILVELGALDVEEVDGGLAAILPEGVAPEALARMLGVPGVCVSAAAGRDNGSVWLLHPRAVRIGSLTVAPPDRFAPPGSLRLADSSAFGTGHHPTTALCIEALEEILSAEAPGGVLDVGTGSGILALAALMLGVPQAVGLDIDAGALSAAAENACLNGLADRLRLVHGGPDAVNEAWPLVVANVLAAPLIEMAPTLVRRVGGRGRLILSGIAASLEPEVRRAYERLGMRHTGSRTRAGWAAVTVRASW